MLQAGIIISVLDSVGKGGAQVGVENMNLMCGLDVWWVEQESSRICVPVVARIVCRPTSGSVRKSARGIHHRGSSNMPGRKAITIRKEHLYPQPPEDVWTAITDPHALAEWFEPNNHRPVVGHRFRFLVDSGAFGHAVKECEVLEADAPRRLVWNWSYVPNDPGRPRPGPMQIAWIIVPVPQGTRLILEHSGAENISWLQRSLMRFGWGYMMKKLIPRILAHVEHGKFTPGAIPLEKRYYTCKTVPEEYAR